MTEKVNKTEGEQIKIPRVHNIFYFSRLHKCLSLLISNTLRYVLILYTWNVRPYKFDDIIYIQVCFFLTNWTNWKRDHKFWCSLEWKFEIVSFFATLLPIYICTRWIFIQWLRFYVKIYILTTVCLSVKLVEIAWDIFMQKIPHAHNGN